MSTSRLKELIELIDKETDPKKFLALVTELNEILDRKKPLEGIDFESEKLGILNGFVR